MSTRAERRRVLEAYAAAMAREAHSLEVLPELTWQQLHNRLQWEGPPVDAVLAEARRRRGTAPPWARTLALPRESSSWTRTWEGPWGDEAGGGSPLCCALSPDGAWVAVGFTDGALRLLHPTTGEELRTLPGHTDRVNACAAGPDGSWLVSASRDGTLRIWDTRSGAPVRTLIGHTSGVMDCAVSADGRLVVSAGWDATLRVWDVRTGAETGTVRPRHGGPLRGCAVGPDGTWAATVGENTAKIVDLGSGEVRETLEGHTSQVTGCAVTPDGARLVTTAADSTVRLWDVTPRDRHWIPRRRTRLLRTFTGHQRQVNRCAASPDGRWVVSAGDDQTLRLWDPVTGESLGALVGHGGPVLACAISPDASWIVSASDDGTLRVWGAHRAAALAEGVAGPAAPALPGRPEHQRAVIACAVSPDGAWFVTSGEDRTVRRWDLSTGAAEWSVPDPEGALALAVAPDGSWGVSSSRRHRVLAAWDAQTGSERLRFTDSDRDPDATRVFACAVGPDGAWLVSLERDGRVRTWDAATGAERRSFATAGGRSCAVSPDGSWLVVTGPDGAAQIWDPHTGRLLRDLEGHRGLVGACAVSRDGRDVVTGADDRTLRVWDPLAGTLRTTVRGLGAPVTGCAVGPGGWVAASAGRMVWIWDLAKKTPPVIFPLPAAATCVAAHPTQPVVVCGDSGGGVFVLRLVGIGPTPEAD